MKKNEPAHSKRVMPVVWALHVAERRQYTPTDSLILITLANYVNGPEGAWPSVPTLAAKCRCNERHARRALRRFEDDGVDPLFGKFERRRQTRIATAYDRHARRAR